MWIIINITLTSLILSIVIVFLDAKLNPRDELKEELINLLPGYDCGMCGFGSCAGMADAIINNSDSYLKCRPLKAIEKEEIVAYLRKKKR